MSIKNYAKALFNFVFFSYLASNTSNIGKMFHKHVAERLAVKTGERYEKLISTIRCKLSFLILKSALVCVRGSRSHNLKTFDEFEFFRSWPGLSKTKIDMFLHVCPFTFV